MSQQNKLTDEEFAVLRREFLENGDLSARNKIVLAYDGLVKSVASQLRNMATTAVQQEDMVSQGMMTLIECVEKFDDTRGMKFESYAYMRIRGSIIDQLRKQDWIPRRVRKNANEINNAFTELSNELLREPTDDELAKYLDMPLQEYVKQSSEISNAVTLSFEDLLQNAKEDEQDISGFESSPEKVLLKTELREVLAKAIDNLRDQEKKVISLYYYNEMFLNEIAEVMNVSPQRIGQVHAKAIMKIKKEIEDYLGN